MVAKKSVDLSVLAGLDDLKLGLNEDFNKQATSNGSPLEIALEAIQPDPEQPRKNFPEEPLKELAESIKASGVFQPIKVFEDEENKGSYFIIAGERRWRASQIAGKDTIPCFISDKDPIGQFVENLQREDLTVFEIADHTKLMLAEGMKKKDLAESIGKNAVWVSRHLSLASAPSYLRECFDAGFCRDTLSLTLLNTAIKDNPKEIKEFCERMNKPISRSDVKLYLDELHSDCFTDTSKTGLGMAGTPGPDGQVTSRTTKKEEPEAELLQTQQPQTQEPEQAGETKTEPVNDALNVTGEKVVSDSVELPSLHFEDENGNVIVAKLSDCFNLTDNSSIFSIEKSLFKKFIKAVDPS